MHEIIYQFEALPQKRIGRIVFQAVEGRKLSEINHRHDFIEIIFLLSGSALHRVNGEAVLMQAGDGVLLTKNDVHCFASQSRDLILLGLSVEEGELLRFASAFAISHELIRHHAVCFHAERIDDIALYCDLILAGETVEQTCSLLLSRLLCLSAAASREGHDMPRSIARAVGEMRRPEMLALGVPGLCRLAGYSYPHLNRLLRQYCAMSPHELVVRMRLDAAYHRILANDTPIASIAAEVGYESVSHFNTVFKKRYGVTPAELRRKERQRSSI